MIKNHQENFDKVDFIDKISAQYVGETGRTFKERADEHLSAIRDAKKIVQLVTISIQEKVMEFQTFLFKFLKNVNIQTLLFVVLGNISISCYFNPP